MPCGCYILTLWSLVSVSAVLDWLVQPKPRWLGGNGWLLDGPEEVLQGTGHFSVFSAISIIPQRPWRMNPSYTELAWDVGLLVFVWSFHRNNSVWHWELLSAAVNTFYGYGLSSRALGMLQGAGLVPILQIIRDISSF